jgi:hypothetical protein
VLSTGNQCFVRICFHSHKIIFGPYKVTVVHKLKQPDDAARIHFCIWLLQNVHDGIVDSQLLFITNEVWFHVKGHVSAQNVRLWSNGTPHTIQQVPYHSEEMEVWCALNLLQIIGPLFFCQTMNSDHYVNDILNVFFTQLTAEERQYEYVEQDNATVHMANTTMVANGKCFKTG